MVIVVYSAAASSVESRGSVGDDHGWVCAYWRGHVVEGSLVLEVHGFGSGAMLVLNMSSRVFVVLLFIFARCVVFG